jgi:hypothetical protein
VGFIAASIGASQEAKAQTHLIRVYDGNDFESYSLDPPYWSYHPKGFWHSRSAHWFYRNHRYIFIDIKLSESR